jgi:anaerobic magnesium-protoporphyrin IX monomethyl ester cyclase
LKAHRKGVRAKDAVDMYARVYQALHAAGIYVVGLFILPPTSGRTSRQAPTGIVCDFQFTADLVALNGSALYDNQTKSGKVSKDMFYHDWNLSSLIVEGGREQISQKSFLDTLREYFSSVAVRQAIGGSALARRFRWRPVGILLERALCTHFDDIRRYRMAKSKRFSMQQKQDFIVRSVLNPDNVHRLKRKNHWLSPLGVRTGFWTTAESGTKPLGLSHEQLRSP